MPSDAENWGRPRRTHPASPWLETLSPRSAGGVVLLAVVLGQLVLAAVVIGVMAVGSLLVWWRRTWSFDGTTLTLDDGVIRRTYRRVPVSRVQHVELNEPLLHRMVGMAVLRIETAGGAGQAEVALDALTRREAAQLQAAVVAARARERAGSAGPALLDGGGQGDTNAGPPPPPPPPPAVEQVVLRLPAGRIMLGGIVSSNLLVVFALMGSLLDVVSRLPRNLAETVEAEAGEAVGALGIFLGVLLLVALALVAAALSALATHHDLTVVRAGQELRMRRGLFERRDAVVPLARVQSVGIRQNPAQRLLGLSSVRIRSAGIDQGGDLRLMVPIATAAEVDRLVTAALGRSIDLADLAPAPPAARGRRIGRRLLVAAAVVTVFAAVGPLRDLVLPVAVATSVLALLLGLDAYRNLGHRHDGDVLVTRWGSIVRRTVVVVVGRVQSVRVAASPLQRVRGLATLGVDLAGRGLTPVVVDQRRDRCLELDALLRQDPVSSPREAYARLGARPPFAPNEEP